MNKQRILEFWNFIGNLEFYWNTNTRMTKQRWENITQIV
jgi:hypothetical protein